MRNKEDLITTAFVKVLRPMRHRWTLNQHPSKPFIENDREPDIIVTEPKRHPIAIEDKVDGERSPDLSGEKQLKDFYLGKTLKTIGHTIHTGLAVRFPHRFREIEQAELDEKMEKADDIAYCLLSVEEPHRFPKEGWLTGSVADIATAIRVRGTPISKIEEAVQTLKNGVNHAAARAEQTIQERPDIGKRIAEVLVQDPGKQTIQMAMLIIGNAFVFQSLLARKPDMEIVPSLSEITEEYGKLSVSEVLEAWKHIQNINYTPIFGVADRLVRVLRGDDTLAGDVLRILRKTALTLGRMGLAQEHELAGIAFQDFIAERKIIKANYTRPESSALLCALVLPKLKKDAKNIKVADFACGTGTLLNGMYQRILALHEQTDGKGEDIHKHMVEKNLLGCDIMPNATHLTVSIIAGTYPDIRIGDTRIRTMKYGMPHRDGRYAIGALDLLSNPEETIPLNLEESETVGGHGNRDESLRQHFRHNEFDYVVQNPPFARIGADNNSDVPKQFFADKTVAGAMRESLKAQKSKIGHGQAGLGSYFVELADKMLKRNGRMGVVLPISAIAGTSWHKVRNLWAREYHDVIIVTIADSDIKNCSFSADTNIAECLIAATKGKSVNTGRGLFVCLYRQPISQLESLEIAKQLHSAHQLANSRLWLSRQERSLEIPICLLSEIAIIGKRILDIKDEAGQRAFDVEEGCHETADYPCLWHVKSELQRAMAVIPDSHALPRPNGVDKVGEIKAWNGRCHYNSFVQFNANSLAVMFTEHNTIGVNLIPNIVFKNKSYDYVWTLWGNSTLGLLCHWMHSGKQQQGRGIIRKEALGSLPTLDVRHLNPFQLEIAESLFHELKHQRMLPFNEMVNDPVRQKLDRFLLSKVLGFGEDTHPEVHEGLDLLRKKLCAEPSIHGNKKSKCDLEGEARKLLREDPNVMQGELLL
ncbi:hypothetical protein F4055_08620 [Candidatus Poribacteria bacterium]|nr:hypothetical protein [Candidatus Poribacteria bacterium]